MSNPEVLIVGAGLAGLCCARRLHEQGIACQILEKSDGVGGRVRTDTVEGFQLDRGFQVLLTAYPEAQRVLDYPALHLQPFYPGALVRFGGRFHRVADPWRRPLDGASLAAERQNFGVGCSIGCVTGHRRPACRRLLGQRRHPVVIKALRSSPHGSPSPPPARR